MAMHILKLPGTDKQLYELVAPLVMNPEVLRQNYNFPFRTTERFEWFVAVDEEGQVLGFIPLEHKRSEDVINNYYVKDKVAEVLTALIKEVVKCADKKRPLSAICFLEDRNLFGQLNFEEERIWTRYVKMRKKQ